MQNIYSIFSIPLVVETNIHQPSKEEISFLENLEYKPGISNLISISENLFDCEEMKILSDKINLVVKKFVKNILNIKNDIVNLNSWSTKTEKGHNHHRHMHPGVFVSAVYYAKTNEKAGNFMLKKHRSSLQEGFNFAFDIEKWNCFNCTSWEVPTKTGDLVIFPGWIDHETQANLSDETRIIVGSNYFLKGQIGQKGTLTKVIL